jgi:hypothetical protein
MLWQVAQFRLAVLPDNEAEQQTLAVLLSGKDCPERAASALAVRPRTVEGRLFDA